MTTLQINRVEDFRVTGTGRAKAWQAIEWIPLALVAGKSKYSTRFKIAWSEKGIYFLVDCEDERISCKNMPDFADLYRGDVVEVFLWPDTSMPVYFEYEISPLGAELPIMVPNRKKRFMGWLPWHYETNRLTRRATKVRGGAAKAGGKITGWSAEFFIPFELLRPLVWGGITPGATWHGNIYRIDYDRKPAAFWAWCPETGSNFHKFESFGKLTFGR